MEHHSISAQVFTSTHITWNCKEFHKGACLAPRKLFPTNLSSWLVLSPGLSANLTDLSFKAHHFCKFRVKTVLHQETQKPCRQFNWPLVGRIQELTQFSCLLPRRKISRVRRRRNSFHQAAKGVSVSIIDTAHKSKNMGVEGLLRLMRPSLHASLSMKQMPQLAVQLRLQAHLTHK